ncbi:hypothetical protein BDU57DRAFT_459451 [Ampelomyces quisqualis]|uniref:RING-type domain-containing protein n=1 Tax=Ampelomyces quisqualis TaxID=50730 RepID=A0A6A5QAN6_AMPQU|nr:hypothetical protein BDU57DRAFT_459451 [Ampelomyces quisqualis]
MATVTQIPGQDDVHPLLRHPRPLTRDSAKAQRMLGFVTDTEEKLAGLQRENSRTTKWLERPLHAHLGAPEKDDSQENNARDYAESTKDDGKHAGLFEQWTTPDQPTSFSFGGPVHSTVEPKTKLDSAFNKRRPEPLKTLRPISYNSQHLLSPEWTVSPATMCPQISRQRPVSFQPSSANVQRSSLSSSTSSESMSRFAHPQTWPVPHACQHADGQPGRPVSYQPPSHVSPQLNERRGRPTSFATYQHRDRRNGKIASSRGLRNNSYPNYSRPISEISSKAVPGEHIESDAVYNRFEDSEVGPPCLSLPICSAPERFELHDTKHKTEKKQKNRWSAIPQTFKKLTGRRSFTAAQESPSMVTMESLRQINLTEGNLSRHQNHSPEPRNHSTLGVNLLPTPSYSPLEFKHPLFQGGLPPPFAPWAEIPPSPASTQEQRRGSDISTSPTRKRTQSRLLVENITQRRPESTHSCHSSLGMPSPRTQVSPSLMAASIPASPHPTSRRGTPSLDRTCILCKTTKDPSTFVNRRITANCWHEAATCFDCLQSHVEKCVTTHGWESCTCPECGERMTYDDIGAFADDDKLVKWDD